MYFKVEYGYRQRHINHVYHWNQNEKTPKHTGEEMGVGVTEQENCFEVIEYSAYQKLESENAALKEKIEIAIDALKFYAMGNFRDGIDFTTVELMRLQQDNGNLAKETLSKLEAGENENI